MKVPLKDSSSHMTAQIDANFGHKHPHVGNDPPLCHPYTHFLDDGDLRAMEDEVEAARPSHGKPPDKCKCPLFLQKMSWNLLDSLHLFLTTVRRHLRQL